MVMNNMTWIYDDPPLSKNDKQTYTLLKVELGNKELAERTIKMVNLYVSLLNHKFKNAREIQDFAFFDKEHKRPVFNARSSKIIFKNLYQKLGGSSNYPATDFVLRDILTIIRQKLPTTISTPVTTLYQAAHSILSGVKGFVPFGDLVLKVANSGLNMGVTTAQDVASEAAGAPGAVAAAAVTAIPVLLASTLDVIDGDLGEAASHMASWMPLIGPITSKGLNEFENIVRTLNTHPEIKSMIPIISDYKLPIQ